MARLTPEGFLQAHFVPTIANTSAPTVAEIGAGFTLHDVMTPAGLDTPEEGQEADASDLGSARDKTVPSTISGQYTCEIYRDDGTAGGSDAAYAGLPRLQDGYLVIARFGGSGANKAIASGDTVEVHQVRVSQRSNNRTARGEALRATIRFSLLADPVENATVAP